MTTRDLIRTAVEASGLNARELSDATGTYINAKGKVRPNVGLHQIWRYIREPFESDITTEMGPPALYDSFMVAATASMNWHASFQLFPREYPDGPLPTDDK